MFIASDENQSLAATTHARLAGSSGMMTPELVVDVHAPFSDRGDARVDIDASGPRSYHSTHLMTGRRDESHTTRDATGHG
jgi:hypothetical protein